MTAQSRDRGKGAAHRCRREGWIPGVIYGKRVGSIPLRLPERELLRHMAEGLGAGAVVEIRVDGEGGTQDWTAVIKEVQRDPVSQQLLHLDLQQVSLEDVLEVEIPVVLKGQEEVARRGGIVQPQLHRVRLLASVTAIPTDVEVDISGLEIGDHVKVADLKLPAGVKTNEDPDEIVVTILAPRHEEEPAPVEEGEEAAAPAGEQPAAGGAA